MRTYVVFLGKISYNVKGNLDNPLILNYARRWADPEGGRGGSRGPDPPPPHTHTHTEKSQVAIGFLRNTDTEPHREAIGSIAS